LNVFSLRSSPRFERPTDISLPGANLLSCAPTSHWRYMARGFARRTMCRRAVVEGGKIQTSAAVEVLSACPCQKTLSFTDRHQFPLRITIPELLRRSSELLANMYDERAALFSYSTRLVNGKYVNDFSNGAGTIRYTINVLAGIQRASRTYSL